MSGFLSGKLDQWNNNVSSGRSNWGSRFFNNAMDVGNNGVSAGDLARAGLSLTSPWGIAMSIGRGLINTWKDNHPKQPQNDWNQSMPERPSMTSQFYGQPGDLNHQMNLPQYGLGGSMNYAGGDPTFNERTGQYAPQSGFLTGFNPTANQYRVMNLNQQRNDAMAGYLNSPSGANPFSHMNPGDMALSGHNAHVQGMDAMRWMGDMNPSNAQAEFNDQNAARYKASQFSK